MNVVLISPYEIGRQPFGLAEPAALLSAEGHNVSCVDLAVQRLADAPLAQADVVAIYVAMHTATRIAVEAMPRIRAAAPRAHLCVYGLYAPMNETLLRELGVATVLGGEFEPALLSMVRRVAAGEPEQSEPVIAHGKFTCLPPQRDGLPDLTHYARLLLPDGGEKIVAFAETTRGCKHLCSHCPVVPVYQGRFRALPRDIVLQDISQQVVQGAQHVSFGDPDFLNGPTHARRIVSALHEQFPGVTYDCTIKVEHLLKHADLLPLLSETGCLFVTSAVESTDERILQIFRKQHTVTDFARAVTLMEQHGIALAPTFVAFTPWTTLEGYLGLLCKLAELQLVNAVPPIQLAIRLLVPEGSYLLRETEMRPHLQAFDPHVLGYPWQHPDGAVDQLQESVQALVAEGEAGGCSRQELFAEIWHAAHRACGQIPPQLPARVFGRVIPHLSEQWYCCAEPTEQQLAAY
ncbi:MAG: CUAEP/CCAEP-tail radical SAM protein [Gammaproteobacteria bacterium]|nr:CUAEP/CCAEP-tail radical SAM protein [Gammaproteobacteria bacterium]